MPQQLKPGEAPQGQGPRTQDYQPVSLSHPDAPMVPRDPNAPGPFAPRPPARQAQAPQQPTYETVPTQGGAPVEPASTMTAEQYMQQADAPLQVPQGPSVQQNTVAHRSPPTSHAFPTKQRSPVLQAIHSVFGLSSVPTETVDIPMSEGTLQVTFRIEGKEDQAWALDMATTFQFETETARNRMFNFAVTSISIAALNGKPIYEVLGVDVSGITIRDPMNPPTLVRYRCATEMFYALSGEGENAMVPLLADLILEHWSAFQARVGAKFGPFFDQLQSLRQARAERERTAFSGANPSPSTQSSGSKSQAG